MLLARGDAGHTVAPRRLWACWARAWQSGELNDDQQSKNAARRLSETHGSNEPFQLIRYV
jgi:hypothetical protein